MTVTPEQVKRLCAASGADEIAALSALERRNGDLLEALLELERQGSALPPARGGFYTTRPQGGAGPASERPEARAAAKGFRSYFATGTAPALRIRSLAAVEVA